MAGKRGDKKKVADVPREKVEQQDDKNLPEPFKKKDPEEVVAFLNGVEIKRKDAPWSQ